jgi:putative membrane protein
MHDLGGWWIVGWLILALIWVGVAALGWWSFKWFSKRNSLKTKQTPLDIAKERYAKGEITKEQFEQIKKDLS